MKPISHPGKIELKFTPQEKVMARYSTEKSSNSIERRENELSIPSFALQDVISLLNEMSGILRELQVPGNGERKRKT